MAIQFSPVSLYGPILSELKTNWNPNQLSAPTLDNSSIIKQRLVNFDGKHFDDRMVTWE